MKIMGGRGTFKRLKLLLFSGDLTYEKAINSESMIPEPHNFCFNFNFKNMMGVFFQHICPRNYGTSPWTKTNVAEDNVGCVW